MVTDNLCKKFGPRFGPDLDTLILFRKVNCEKSQWTIAKLEKLLEKLLSMLKKELKLHT